MAFSARFVTHASTPIMIAYHRHLRATWERQVSDNSARHTLGGSDPEQEKDLRDCLAHFHDYAYLVSHPFLDRIPEVRALQDEARVRAFRRITTRLIERLRPSGELAPEDPAWRPYRVLQQRYLMGQEMAAVQVGMQMSKRQLHREQRRGLQALLASLTKSAEQPLGASQGDQDPQDSLRSHVLPDRSAFGPVDVLGQIERAIASVQPLADAQNVTLRIHSAAPSLVIDGYPALFRQLLVGLFSLAIRHTEGSTVSIQAASSDPRYCTVTLEIACPSHSAPEPLAIGSVQTALAQVQQADLDVFETSTGTSIKARWPSRPSQETVLLVEDNPDLVSLMTVYLREQGYTVVAVSDSLTATEQIRGRMPDYVVLDVVLQGIDGWELLRQLKADERTREIPVVICSVLQEPELANALGADAYLPKPITPADLRQCLDRLAEQRRGLSARPR